MADIQTVRAVRLRKARALRELGVNLYPEHTPKRLAAAEIQKHFSAFSRSRQITIAGRITGLRVHGGAAFLDCTDASGKLQVLFSRKALGKAFTRVPALDLGDFLAVRGKLIRTRRGEATLEARGFTVLAKALRPIPAHWYGLRDVEERFRRREIDLLLNPEVRQRFRVRSEILRTLRRILEDESFLEVETPILQAVPGGAHAEPFRTMLRALKLPLYLRTAPELYLKRLLVGGFEKVYELGRSFRNEGMDHTHNPEFTELEFYWAYQDLKGLMAFSERMIRRTVRETMRTSHISFRGAQISFSRKFRRLEFSSLFQNSFRVDPITASDSTLVSIARRNGVPTGPSVTRAILIDHLFKKTVAPTLVQPAFVVHHPLSLSPLAKAVGQNSQLARRFQIFAGGMEVANAYAELNDPREQRKRFVEEAKHRRSGNREAQRTDEDFLTALEYGMPPAAGFGLGVDRFVMLLTDAPSLREVLLFPTMRPKK
ncbi:MAG: lysine--tRNA ligase [Candidatus Terrybacteria bacterium RIFCSPLOWO2_01_FULL_58_14]|uniref:Lysine--tRNA ligase n=1 Tax=Candidatus Terrybacteria bacterium RIFCSPLOWO2_01_FULL_58_14 TaxID=1802369 RepID=A0A1G2PVG9_9BACT|nr:MAG: lysine--tRNA ligase [Candidatus Terrybacteria bacterium RIFCSPLOWO2_01_FULL_58_14]